MITVSDDFKLAYRNFSGIHTKIQIGTVLYDDGDIVEGSLSITESVCSGEEINYRSVEKSCLRVSLFTSQTTQDLKGKTLIIYQECDGESETLPLGVYIIDDARRKGQEVTITAYDRMSLFNQDVSSWYSGLTFPVTVSALLTSLAAAVGISTALPQTFTNSAYPVPDWAPGEITGTQVIAYLQEVCGGFFRCNRSGALVFTQIDFSAVAKAYQPQDLEQGSIEISDYDCETIDKLQIITSADHSTDIVIGTGSNIYTIDNPLLYGLTDQTVAQAIFNALSAITYTPFRADTAESYPWIEVGDTVSVTTIDGEAATAPLLKRSMSGAKLCRGTIESHGLMLRSQGVPLSEHIDDVTGDLDRRVTALEQGGGGGGTATGIEGYPEVWIRNYSDARKVSEYLSSFIHLLYNSVSNLHEIEIGFKTIGGFLMRRVSGVLKTFIGWENSQGGENGFIYERDSNYNSTATMQTTSADEKRFVKSTMSSIKIAHEVVDSNNEITDLAQVEVGGTTASNRPCIISAEAKTSNKKSEVLVYPTRVEINNKHTGTDACSIRLDNGLIKVNATAGNVSTQVFINGNLKTINATVDNTNILIDGAAGKIYLNAPNGVFVNGTQVGP